MDRAKGWAPVIVGALLAYFQWATSADVSGVKEAMKSMDARLGRIEGAMISRAVSARGK